MQDNEKCLCGLIGSVISGIIASVFYELGRSFLNKFKMWMRSAYFLGVDNLKEMTLFVIKGEKTDNRLMTASMKIDGQTGAAIFSGIVSPDDIWGCSKVMKWLAAKQIDFDLVVGQEHPCAYEKSLCSFGLLNPQTREALKNMKCLNLEWLDKGVINFTSKIYKTSFSGKKIVEYADERFNAEDNLDRQFDYGLIVKHHPTKEHESVWICCGGNSFEGTKGAAHILTSKSEPLRKRISFFLRVKYLHRFFHVMNTTECLAVVKVKRSNPECSQVIGIWCQEKDYLIELYADKKELNDFFHHQQIGFNSSRQTSTSDSVSYSSVCPYDNVSSSCNSYAVVDNDCCPDAQSAQVSGYVDNVN